MATSSSNTFPPLVSGSSLDLIGQKQLFGKTVLASCVIKATVFDPFFYPAECKSTGFAWDGNFYQEGEPTGFQASWFTEAPGPWRAATQVFPQRGVVLLTDAGLSILDRDRDLEMWMTFMRGDNLAYTNNFLLGQKVASGFTPQQVVYQNGIISVTQFPDPGSLFYSPFVLHIDFLHDDIYVDCSWDPKQVI